MGKKLTRFGYQHSSYHILPNVNVTCGPYVFPINFGISMISICTHPISPLFFNFSTILSNISYALDPLARILKKQFSYAIFQFISNADCTKYYAANILFLLTN